LNGQTDARASALQEEHGVPRPLSHRETGRALRAFIYTGGMWGAWGQMVGVGTSVLTGYALWLGATEAEIAFFVSVVFLTSLAQIVSPVVIGRTSRHKTVVFLTGCLEITLYSSIVLVPLLFHGPDRILAMGAFVGLAMMCGQLVSPVYNEWLAVTTPPRILGKFTARRTNAQLLTGIVAAYLVGWYLDLFPKAERYTGFATVFAGAALLGIGGYLNLMRVPFRRMSSVAPTAELLLPFRDPRFRKLLIFYLTWHLGLGLALPFYSVFMLKTLQIGYARVAVLNGLFMAAMVVGYMIWGTLVDRYGSKAILQILIAPMALGPVLWTFNRPDAYLLIPVAMVLNGLVQAGILVSTNALLYGILPHGAGKTHYFAAWSCLLQLALCAAAVVGGVLVRHFESVDTAVFGFSVGNLQLVFLISAGALFFPNLLVGSLEDNKGTTPRQLLAQIGRGNLLSYLYGSMVYEWTSSERMRARATRRMGMSGSPMALGRLTRALDDASPEIRRHAALGLGEARSVEAVIPLLEELADEESDIRSEAAIALGKIGDPAVIDPLLEAVDDSDPRVRISAINALSEIGGDEAEGLLFWIFVHRFDRLTFPTLADALGRVGDLRMIRPTLDRLSSFRSPAIRLQLLNSVCRVLGGESRFYQTVSLDELPRAERMEELIKQAKKAFSYAQSLGGGMKTVLADLAAIQQSLDVDTSDGLPATIQQLVSDFQTWIVEGHSGTFHGQTASRVAAVVLAINTYCRRAEGEESPETRDVFLVVCLWCLGHALEEVGRQGGTTSTSTSSVSLKRGS